MSNEPTELKTARNFEAEFCKKQEELYHQKRECDKMKHQIEALEKQMIYLLAVKETTEAFLGRKIGGGNEQRKID